MFLFYVPPKTKIIRRRDFGLKSHPKTGGARDATCDSLSYKGSHFSTTSWPLLLKQMLCGSSEARAVKTISAINTIEKKADMPVFI